MNFNEEQLEAINHGTGPALVLAGPGSGKTAVITGRALRLVKECQVKPEELLVITFTKAAAEEMKQRYLKEAAYSEGGVCFGTFHAVFFRILRESTGLSQNALVKPSEQYRYVMERLNSLHPGRNYSAEDIKHILGEISHRKNGGRQMNLTNLVCTESEFNRLYEDYNRALREGGRIDFDDILLECHKLLANNSKVREHWQQAFRYILVDEFQDINQVQYETVRLLAARHGNLFAVGDDDQSIYAFRGAKPGLIEAFLEDYPKAKTVVLGKNYRSARCITRAANALIRYNTSHRNKAMSNPLEKSGRVEIREYEDRRAEYFAVVEELQKAEIPLAECAVLFRTHSEARGLAEELERKNIPFVLKEALQDLSNHRITRELMAYLKIAEGDRERRNYLLICNHPYRGITRECFPDSYVNPEACLKAAKVGFREKLAYFFEEIKPLSGLEPYGAIYYIRKVLGYEAYLYEFAAQNGLNVEELLEILEFLQETATGAKNSSDWEDKLTRTFSEHVQRAGEKAGEGVRLMTFHASKGLEFRRVYLMDLNEGVAPLKHAKEEAAIEEERRAMYVAMTRAKEELLLNYTKKRGGRVVLPSRFIHEIKSDIPNKLVTELS